jgi:hypothetical protein
MINANKIPDLVKHSIGIHYLCHSRLHKEQSGDIFNHTTTQISTGGNIKTMANI